MPKLTPKEASQKWARRATAAVPEYKAGIERVTESPTAKAAQAVEKLIANFMESVTSGRWARNLEAVSLSEWKTAASEKGGARMAAGVQGAIGKQERYYTEVFPFIETLQAQIKAMPSLTLEDSIARSNHFMREMHAFKNRRG